MLRRVFAVNENSSLAMKSAADALKNKFQHDLETRVMSVHSLENFSSIYHHEPNTVDVVFVEDKGDIGRLPALDTYYAIGRSQESETSESPTPEMSVSFAIDKGLEAMFKGVETATARAHNKLLREERGDRRKGVVSIVGATGRIGVEATKYLATNFLKTGEGRVQLLDYGLKMDSLIKRLSVNPDSYITDAFDRGIIRVVDQNEMLDTSQVIVYVPSKTDRDSLDRFDQFRTNWSQIFKDMFADEAKHPAAEIPFRIIGSGYGESLSRKIHEMNVGKRFPIITYTFASQDQERVRAVLTYHLKNEGIPKKNWGIDDLSLIDGAQIYISGTHRTPILLPDSSYLIVPDGNGGIKMSLRDAFGIEDSHVHSITRKVQESAVDAYNIDESPDEFTLAIPYAINAIINGGKAHFGIPFNHSNDNFSFSADRLKDNPSMAISVVNFNDMAKPKPLFMPYSGNGDKFIALSNSEKDILLRTLRDEDLLHYQASSGI